MIALHTSGTQELDAVDRGFLVSTVLHVLGVLLVLVVAGRVLYSRLGVDTPTMSILATAVLCIGIAFGLAAPVEIAWSDGCNDFSGIAPLIAAATFEAGLTQSPSSFTGLGTLVLCA